MKAFLILFVIFISLTIILVYGLSGFLLVKTARIVSKGINKLSSLDFYIAPTSKGLLVKYYGNKSLNLTCLKLLVDNKTTKFNYTVIGNSNNLLEKDEVLFLDAHIPLGEHELELRFCEGKIKSKIYLP